MGRLSWIRLPGPGVPCVQRALGGGGGRHCGRQKDSSEPPPRICTDLCQALGSSVGGDHSSESLGKDSIVAIQLGMAVGRLPSMATFLFKGAMLLGMLLAISGPFSCSHSL